MANQKARIANGLVVRRSRSGLGLFTTEPVKKGRFVIEYTGEVISNDEADRRGGRYLFEINSKWTIDAKCRKNLARYINHSCRPNCEAREVGGRIKIYAKRNIKAGEEIMYHYGKGYFADWIKKTGCTCEKCRERKRRKNKVHNKSKR